MDMLAAQTNATTMAQMRGLTGRDAQMFIDGYMCGYMSNANNRNNISDSMIEKPAKGTMLNEG